MRPIHRVLAILALTAPGLGAQTFVYQPAPGSEIRITTIDAPARRPIGVLDWVGKDSVIIRSNLRLSPDPRRQAFALTNVRSIEVNRRGRLAALAYGSGIGALAGLVLVPGDDPKGRAALVIGALAGALVGQSVIPDRWETVFRR